jgi:antitoxin YefM
MRITYRLKASELDNNFLEDLQKTYKDKEIEIIVQEIDETEYLFKSPFNQQKLLEAKENVERGIHLVNVNLDYLE